MPSAPTERQLTRTENLHLVFALAKTLATTLCGVFLSAFRGKNGSSSYFKDVIYRGMRAYSDNLTLRQLQAITPSTDDAYHDFMAKENLKPRSVIIDDDGTRAHCIGQLEEAGKVLVWFHGGGYVLPGGAGHMAFLYESVVKSTNSQMAAVFLSYTLAPKANYPDQLRQAVSLILHLVRVQNVAPSNIVLGGDSAGGNLALDVLSHIIHPHRSQSIPRLAFDGHFLGCILLSPWVTFEQESPSMRTNAWKDCISRPAVQEWSSVFRGPHSHLGDAVADFYLEPKKAHGTWWDGKNWVADL